MDWRTIHEFWFPAELARGELAFHMKMGDWWMRGGATPELPPFAHYVAAAAAGDLDHWKESAAGRLCLIVVLDQFPRGLFAGTPGAYAHDGQALRLCEEGFANGQAYELEGPFEQFFFTMPMVHAEGPGHLDRLRRLLKLHQDAMPAMVQRFPELEPIFRFAAEQVASNIDVIERFGRFPHRNDILGRTSTDQERAYIDAGEFVHLRRPNA